MKYFTQTIPYELAEKLKAKGMPLGRYVYCPDGGATSREEAGTAYYENQLAPYCTYADVFDWLMGKGYRINIHTKPAINPIKWFSYIGTMYPDYCIIRETRDCDTWHSAADAAIEKALELIK